LHAPPLPSLPDALCPLQDGHALRDELQEEVQDLVRGHEALLPEQPFHSNACAVILARRQQRRNLLPRGGHVLLLLLGQQVDAAID
jgi:hypothetical protein